MNKDKTDGKNVPHENICKNKTFIHLRFFRIIFEAADFSKTVS